MLPMPDSSLAAFYEALARKTGRPVDALPATADGRALGHFNLFDLGDWPPHAAPAALTFSRRTYYSIYLLAGSGRATYEEQELTIRDYSLWFATPHRAFAWWPDAPVRTGYLCVFTAEFLRAAPGPGTWEQLPLLQPGGQRVLALGRADYRALRALGARMQQTLASQFAYKYELLRAYLLELLYYGQQLQTASPALLRPTAAGRLAGRFIDLLERQFPLTSPQQLLRLRTAADFAQALAVHPSHLNRTLHLTHGLSTSALLAARFAQEAKLLLRQTDWSLTEIADCLGFASRAHFGTFFKRQTGLAPGTFRGKL